MKNKLFAVLSLMLLFTVVDAQSKLDHYIQIGIDSNLSIKQQNLGLQKSIYALQEAKSLFAPEIGIDANYTKAAGGRTIEIPLGDLLNQTYSTLNQLTNSSKFPQLNNQHVLLNPYNFYDAKLHSVMPLINAELIYNKRIKAKQRDVQALEAIVFKRELVREIKNAYYQYASASNAVLIYRSSLKLVSENKRINKALFDNQKANRTAVTRSENEVARISAELTSALASKESAKAYFNFLINKAPADSIEMDAIESLPDRTLVNDGEIHSREEITQLHIEEEINENLIALNKSYLVPKVGTFLDLGSQAYDWKVNTNSKYYLFGISLHWDLLAFGRNSSRIKQAKVDQQILNTETDYTLRQLQTQLIVVQNDYKRAVAKYQSARSQLQATEQYYKDELNLYKEGQALYIELLDAQNQLVNAKLQSNIALFDSWSRYADIERATASFSIN